MHHTAHAQRLLALLPFGTTFGDQLGHTESGRLQQTYGVKNILNGDKPSAKNLTTIGSSLSVMPAVLQTPSKQGHHYGFLT